MSKFSELMKVLEQVNNELLAYKGKRVSVWFYDEKEEGVVDGVDVNIGCLFVWLDCEMQFEHEEMTRERRPYLQIDFKDVDVKGLELI